MRQASMMFLCWVLGAVQLVMAQSPPVAVPSGCGLATDDASVSLRKDLDRRHDALMERFRKWKIRADAFNQKYAGHEFDVDSQEAKDGAAEQAWLSQESKDYQPVARAFKTDV